VAPWRHMPVQHVRSTVWIWDKTNQWINGSTARTDTCNRVTNSYSHLAVHNYR